MSGVLPIISRSAEYFGLLINERFNQDVLISQFSSVVDGLRFFL